MAADADSTELSGKARSALRARAQALKPVVWIGDAGATAGALREIDRALEVHELIKIHAAVSGRAQRAALLEELCARLGAVPVQVIGKMLVAYRPRPAETPVSDAKPAPRPASRPALARRRSRRS